MKQALIANRFEVRQFHFEHIQSVRIILDVETVESRPEPHVRRQGSNIKSLVTETPNLFIYNGS